MDRREDEINLLDYLVVLLKRKNLIFWFTIACALLGVVAAFVIPPKYKAETRILPPQTGASVYSEVLSQFGGGVAGLGKRAWLPESERCLYRHAEEQDNL
jgi:uncharacterized protein involved in exopolysaccharide biosynthesis